MPSLTQQDRLTKMTHEHALSLRDYLLDPEDEQHRDPQEILWVYSSHGPSLVGITLVARLEGPRIEIQLPTGYVNGWWGDCHAVSQGPLDVAETLFEYFADLEPFPTG